RRKIAISGGFSRIELVLARSVLPGHGEMGSLQSGEEGFAYHLDRNQLRSAGAGVCRVYAARKELSPGTGSGRPAKQQTLFHSERPDQRGHDLSGLPVFIHSVAEPWRRGGRPTGTGLQSS